MWGALAPHINFRIFNQTKNLIVMYSKEKTKPLITKKKRGPIAKPYSQIMVIKNLLNTKNWFSEMDLTKATVPNLEKRYEKGHRASRSYINKLRNQGMGIISREIINPYTNNPTIEYGLAGSTKEFYKWIREEGNVDIKLKRGRRKLND
mgnify:FL=1|jgi:hypothetical protein|tara:strand:- start:1271 stop:1717 length:447 start_codon:yes stop_codon:yes gene_type:complete